MRFLSQNRNKSAQVGFSLIELLVAVALFTVVMTVAVGTFLAIIDANRKSQSLKSVINNLNFGVDSMARTIRTGVDYYCTNTLQNSLPTGTRNCPNGMRVMIVTDDRNRRVGFRFNPGCPAATSGQPAYPCIERNVQGTGWLPFTAPEVVIDEMFFYVTGAAPSDTLQPTATISIRGRAGGNDVITDSEFNLQTTVTQRILDE